MLSATPFATAIMLTTLDRPLMKGESVGNEEVEAVQHQCCALLVIFVLDGEMAFLDRDSLMSSVFSQCTRFAIPH